MRISYTLTTPSQLFRKYYMYYSILFIWWFTDFRRFLKLTSWENWLFCDFPFQRIIFFSFPKSSEIWKFPVFKGKLLTRGWNGESKEPLGTKGLTSARGLTLRECKIVQGRMAKLISGNELLWKGFYHYIARYSSILKSSPLLSDSAAVVKSRYD